MALAYDEFWHGSRICLGRNEPGAAKLKKMNKRLWTKFIVGAALGLSLLAAPARAVPLNTLLVNGSFEQGKTGRAVGSGFGDPHFPGWGHNGGSNLSHTHHTPFTGKSVASFGATKASKRNYLYQTVANLQIGHRYQLGGHYRVTGRPVVTTPTPLASPVFYPNSNSFTAKFGTKVAFAAVHNLPQQSGFFSFAAFVTATQTAEQVGFGGFNNTAFTRLDDLFLVPASTPTPEIDTHTIALPLALAAGTLMLAGDRRRRTKRSTHVR